MNLTNSIKQKALDLGFDLVGITDAAPIDSSQIKYLQDWLDAGYAGQMTYMHKNFEKRTNPAKLLKDAKSVICVALNYTPPKTKSKASDKPTAQIANYAQYEDYHIFIKKLLYELADFIKTESCDPDFKFKACVDSVPLAERALAQRAGLGFIGKNHMLINPELGPQLLLGEIITNIKLEIDGPMNHSCKDCSKCIKACRTEALQNDGRFNANKCISYLTIEYKGDISQDLAGKFDGQIFGCDKCVAACPYTKNAPACKNKRFKFYPDRTKIELDRILKMTEKDFESEFADSPILRATLPTLKRNAKICINQNPPH